MVLVTASETKLASAISRLAFCNPFSHERMEAERDVLGREPAHDDPELYRQVWAGRSVHPDVAAISARTAELAEVIRDRFLHKSKAPSENDLRLYEEVVLYHLDAANRDQFDVQIDLLINSQTGNVKPLWEKFSEMFRHFYGNEGVTPHSRIHVEHVFALFFQIRRAYYHIYMNIVGASKPAIELRKTVWQSIFTCDLRRYARTLYKEMDKCATLITGPSGTGKEIVARAVGWSRYIPFDWRKKTFAADFTGSFLALNLSAFAPTLIESELFGHAKGAFNGAIERKGWLQLSDRWSTVFLDEIGELDPAIQVKLLRVLQNREFQRVGESMVTPFQGKIIAATNRDLTVEMRAGRFRPDLYYRLQSDMITTPGLKEQLDDSPEDLRKMVLFVAQRATGEETASEAPEAEKLADEVVDWVERHLRGYSWPGNFRELEQCVRNIMIRNAYYPATVGSDVRQSEDAANRLDAGFIAELSEGKLSLAQLERWYFTRVYFRTGNYQQAARRIGADWRTLKKKVDVELLCRFREDAKRLK